MDPDPPTTTNRPPLDDAALALLIRDVADEWSIPPQRLDELTWRDRVGRSREAGNASGWRWPRRFPGATAVAVVVVATMSLSLAAVWLMGQRGDQATIGSSPSPVGSSSPMPSGNAVPAASPMPKLFRNGDLPTPSRLLVETTRGFHIADLATGELSPLILDKSRGPTGLLPRPGGGWVCICADGGNAMRLSATTVDTNGALGAPTPIRDIVAARDPSESDAMQTFLADVSVTASPDGRFALVGWIYRDAGAGWQIGSDVLDLDTLATVASTQLLLNEPIVIDGRARLPFAPIVRLSPAGDQILLATLASVDETGRGPGPGAGQWVASFDGRSIGTLTNAPIPTADACLAFDAGFTGADALTDDAVYYAACRSPAGSLVVNRMSADGGLVSTTEMPGVGGIDSDILAPISGGAFFSWNPFDAVISRLDLRTGERSVGDPQLPSPGGLTNPLGDLIVVSADGTRVYALRTASSDPGIPGDAAGIYVFDALTLALLGHWVPTANFTSIAVSADGRHLYAAAGSGANVAGHPAPEFGASVTVYDTSDGSVALLAGRLGAYDLALGEAICR